MQPVTFDPNYDYPPAFAGMIADSMFTDKVTVPCGTAPIPYGAVVASVAATGVSVLPVGTNPVEGVAIHDHRGGARLVGNGDNYVQGDAMSVMRRGRIWARASGACTKDAVAKYDPATGLFADAGTGTLPNAKFVTANITVAGIDTGSQSIVQVELHSPAV